MNFPHLFFYSLRALVLVASALRGDPGRATRCTRCCSWSLAFFTGRRRLAAARRRIPRHHPGPGLCRRGGGAVPVRGDDARHQLRRAARGLLGQPAARRGRGHPHGGRDGGAAVARLRSRAPDDRARPAGELRATPRPWGACSTPTTSSPSRSPRSSCWWRSSPPSRITLRHRKETKYQDARTQLEVRASDRLKIIKFPPEPSANRAPDTGGPT